jgi:hypothetical protein
MEVSSSSSIHRAVFALLRQFKKGEFRGSELEPNDPLGVLCVSAVKNSERPWEQYRMLE